MGQIWQASNKGQELWHQRNTSIDVKEQIQGGQLVQIVSIFQDQRQRFGIDF